MEPQTRFTADTNIRLRYLEWQGEGLVILLLHGLTVSAEYWALTARLLAPEHRVVAVDLRGHGQSDKPDWGYDYRTLARDMDQLCEEADLKEALVAGHSWGAGVALRLAASYPRRAAHLAMVDGGFGGWRRVSDAPSPDYSQMMAPPEIYKSRATYLKAAGASLTEVMGPEIEEILMASVTVQADGTISERLSKENHIRILKAMGQLDARELYHALQVPVLFVASLSPDPQQQERMQWKREAVRGARESVSSSREVWFPDTSHNIQMHRPQELARTLEDFIHQ